VGFQELKKFGMTVVVQVLNSLRKLMGEGIETNRKVGGDRQMKWADTSLKPLSGIHPAET